MSDRILIISYYYPPENSISSRRPLAFAKALQKNGYDVTVLTRHWEFDTYKTYNDFNTPSALPTEIKEEDGIRTIRIGFRHIHPFHYFLRFGITGVDALFWLRATLGKGVNLEMNVFYNFYSFLKQHLKQNYYNTVLISPFPVNLMRVLHKLKKNFAFSIVDIRDYYNNFIFKKNYQPSFSQKIQNNIFERYMAKWLQGISLISAVNEPILEGVSKYNNSPKLKVLNGYELAMTNDLKKGETLKFTITLIGAIYFQQKLDLVIKAFLKFLKNKEDVKVLFLGLKMFPDVALYMAKNLTEKTVEITDRVSRNEALTIAYNSHILFYLGWKGYRGIYSGKIFEYLGLHKNILICPGDDDVIDKLMADTNAGKCVDTAQEMAHVLEEWYNEWKTTGSLRYHGIEEKIARYTRESQSDLLVNAINHLKKENRT